MVTAVRSDLQKLGGPHNNRGPQATVLGKDYVDTYSVLTDAPDEFCTILAPISLKIRQKFLRVDRRDILEENAANYFNLLVRKENYHTSNDLETII